MSAAQTYTGPTQIQSGVVALPTTVGNALSSSTVVTVATGATLDLSGRSQTLEGLGGGGTVYSFNSSASTLTLAVGAGQSHHFSGTLGSSDPNFGLTKSSAGAQTLSGANTYTGGTLVSAGILNLANTSGSALGTGTVAIQIGGLPRHRFRRHQRRRRWRNHLRRQARCLVRQRLRPVLGDSFGLFDFTTGTAAFNTLDLPTLSPDFRGMPAASTPPAR